MRNGFLHLLHMQTHRPPPLLLLVYPHQLRQRPAHSNPALLSVNPPPILPRRVRTRSRRWDSNAENFRTQNFDFSSLDDEDDDYEDDDTNQWLDILEDFIDGVWIFKVFRSFGWMLPAIISSLLLASGPKAFLMALAIPIGQSALSLVFQTVWGKPKNRRKHKGKTKRKPTSPPRTSRPASYTDIDDEEEQAEEFVTGGRKERRGYQTWVAGDGVTSNKETKDSSSFGGWEDLDRGAQFDMRSTKNSNERQKMSKGKLSKKERRSDTPLLLRLLIAVFPFLGSWTRML